MTSKIEINVKGQSGYLPNIGLGTANLGDKTASAVCTALHNGYTLIDAALLYGNQDEVGGGIRMSGVSRDKFQITTKVGFFPPNSEGVWMYNPNNVKGQETESIELCLKQLSLEYVDLVLLHNPIVSVPEYRAASSPHFFELLKMQGDPNAIKAETLTGGESIRPLVIDALMSKAKQEAISKEEAFSRRKLSWSLLEKAYKEGKTKMIGVSNYPAELLEEMKGYAEIMPAVNQIEYHPRFSSPSTYAKCKELGISLQSYGVLNSVFIGNKKVNDVINNISERTKRSPIETCIRWTVQNNVGAIVRSGSRANQASNLHALEGPDLTDDDMESINSLNENHPYYWLPDATTQTI